jgi:hypothetical protein
MDVGARPKNQASSVVIWLTEADLHFIGAPKVETQKSLGIIANENRHFALRSKLGAQN